MSGLIDIDGLVKIDTTNPLFNFFDSLKIQQKVRIWRENSDSNHTILQY